MATLLFVTAKIKEVVYYWRTARKSRKQYIPSEGNVFCKVESLPDLRSVLKYETLTHRGNKVITKKLAPRSTEIDETMEVQCRLCLGQTSSKLVMSLTNDEMRLMLDTVFNFQIASVSYLSESVCLQCSSTVQEFYHYSNRVQRNQELLEGECLESEDKSCENVKFENVIIDTRVYETANNEQNCELDVQTEDAQYTVDDDCQMMYDTEGEESVSDEADRNGGSIKSDPDVAADSMQVKEEFEPTSGTYDGDIEAALEEIKVPEQDARGGDIQGRFLHCNLCDRLFSNSLHFKTHQREHRKKDCPICEKRVHANYLQRHIADVHKAKAGGKKRPVTGASVQLPASQYERDRMIDVFIGIRCDLCQFGVCQTFADLQEHYRVKHGEQGYVRCCGDKFATQDSAAQHVLEHQGTIRCEICDKTFTTKSSLVKHKALVHPSKEGSSGARGFRCRLCSAVFSNKAKFINHRSVHERKDCHICGKSIRKNYVKKHIADVHAVFVKDEECSSGEAPSTHLLHINDQMILDYLGMRCELCPPETEQNFDQFKHLRTHYRTEHGIRGYVRCCGRQFFIRSLAAEHIAAHQGTLRCHLCEKTFTARSSVVNHIATMHPAYNTDNGTYHCDECDSTFLNKLQLRLHKKRHKLTPIECSLCGKTVRSDYIQQHIATQHGDERRKLMCHICGKDFASEAALKVHIKQHVNPDAANTAIDRTQCSVCNKMIRGKYSLKKHMKDMHSDASNQGCTICGKFIRSKTAMKQHLKMHEGQGHEKLQCPFCGKWIKGKNYLNKHIQCLHNEKGQIFRCDVCQHESPNSQALAAHKQRVHVRSDESLECEYCGKTFKRLIYLREHVALHTGELLYTCEFCDKKFKSNANYYSHRKKNHAEQLQAKNDEQIKTEQNERRKNEAELAVSSLNENS